MNSLRVDPKTRNRNYDLAPDSVGDHYQRARLKFCEVSLLVVKNLNPEEMDYVSRAAALAFDQCVTARRAESGAA